jgi:hypothetical protein
MALPLATTTIAVKRLPAAVLNAEPYGVAVPLTTIASGVRAVLGKPRMVERVSSGEQAEMVLELRCDPTDIEHLDQVVDERIGRVYEVVGAELRTGVGMDFVQATVKRVQGL